MQVQYVQYRTAAASELLEEARKKELRKRNFEKFNRIRNRAIELSLQTNPSAD